MLANLESNNELFDVGIYIAVSAKSKNELDSVTKSIKGICQRHHITVASAVMRQEDALNSILPLAQDYLRITDYLLSSVTANLLPFTYDRLFSPDGYFYGEDTMSKTPIIIDRKSDKNGNGFYLGKPGSGKSMFAKLEIEDTLYQTSTDRIIVIDAESEFVSQCRAHNGTVIKISSDSRNYINIFELADNQSGSEDVIKNKADLMLSVMGVFKNAPLTAQEKTIISRCTMLAYKRYIASGFDRSYLPTLLDFDRELLCQPEKDVCGDLHLYLEMYVTGANDIFSHQTNVDLANRYIDFDLRDLGANLKKAGMLILLDFVQQQVFRNFENGIWSWLYVDEFQTFYTENDDENSPGIFFEKMFARFRKYGGLATGLTQNISRVLEFSTAQSMLQNSQFIVLLEQAPENLKRITDMYGLSERQSGKLISPDVGEGVLVYKNVPYPFRKKYPENNIIYRTVTTKFQDHINAVKSK
ncbi:MAG: VirB4-like conjugal transfer ATPase, CD1110 family, partial [Acutalibacteraceae bacterium]